MRLTRRGKILLGVVLAIAIYLVSTRLWWTDSGYCWGTIEKCLKIEEGVK